MWKERKKTEALSNKVYIWKYIDRHTAVILVLCAIITAVGLSAVWKLNGSAEKQSIQQGIAKEIIRFHVLGNSDSEEDQKLKMTVKEEVIAYLNPFLKEAESVEETRSILNTKISAIREKADEVIRKEGYGYVSEVQLAECYFPMKSYGDSTFPAGTYEALRIRIGEAKGKNWWCVLFPNLCFLDSLHAVVPEAEKEELKNVLTEEEYDSLFVKSRLLEFVKSLK